MKDGGRSRKQRNMFSWVKMLMNVARERFHSLSGAWAAPAKISRLSAASEQSRVRQVSSMNKMRRHRW